MEPYSRQRVSVLPKQFPGLLGTILDRSPLRRRILEWLKRFKEGREEVEDDPRSGRPSTSRTEDNIEHVKQMVRADCRLMVGMIAEELSISPVGR